MKSGGIFVKGIAVKMEEGVLMVREDTDAGATHNLLVCTLSVYD